MPKTTKRHTLNTFFIFSTSIEKLNGRIRELTFIARQASFERDYKKVVLVANELVKLSPRSESPGRYFQALALSQQGKGNKDYANNIFKILSEENPSPVKDASLLALGVSAYQDGDYGMAHSYIKKSTECSTKTLLTSTICETLRAAICSATGKHKESVLIYEKVLPKIIELGKLFPAYANMELNNLAYDLNKVGEYQVAAKIIQGVIASPSASFYPEWKDTLNEINVKKSSHSFVAIKGAQSGATILPFRHKNPPIEKIEATTIFIIKNSQFVPFGKCPVADLAEMRGFLIAKMNPQSEFEENQK
jgi:hypothetical protein